MMGSTASILPHGRGIGNKAEETSLLRLYNRNCRDDIRLSKDQLLTTCVEDPKLEHRSTFPCKGGGQHPTESSLKTSTLTRTTGGYAATNGDEGWHHSRDNIQLDKWRVDRARARDKAVVQMYNSCRGNLVRALENMRESLHQSSIDGTSWATVAAVSAALEQSGATVDDSTVFLLANKLQDTHYSTGPAQEQFKGTGMVATFKTRLVHWPSIIEFFEEAPSTDAVNCTTSSEFRQGWQVPRAPNTRAQSRCVTRRDSEPAMLAGTDDECSPPGEGGVKFKHSPELTPESRLEESGGEVEKDDCYGSTTKEPPLSGTVLLEQGLCSIHGGLQIVEVNGIRLSHSRIGEVMDSIRDILRVKAGINLRSELNRRGADRRRLNDIGSGSGFVSETPRDSDECKGQSGKDRDALEGLISAACAAGKRGDVSALQDLEDIMDLRMTDAFGRNPLYYACLCGHVYAVHFAVVRVYGGIQGIPEKERSECRTNALSEAIRRYLDTGILPDETPAEVTKTHEERPPAQAVPIAREKEGRHGSTASALPCEREDRSESLDGEVGDRVIHGDGSPRSGAHNAASPAEPTISIAFLFGCDQAQEKDEEDY